MNKNKKPFYGWAIVGVGALGNAIQGGFIFWSMGMYTSAFEDYFNTSRARVTLVETCITVGVNVMFPLAGWWVDKRSARLFAALGMASIGTGLVLISQAGTLVQVWVVFATLIPLGVLGVGVLPSGALISRWFRKRRGLALGINVTGSSIGGFLGPPFVAYLFAAHGWRTALLFAGIGVIFIAPLVYTILSNDPKEKGMEPLKDEGEHEPEREQADGADWTIRELLRLPTTYLQAITSGCLLAITLGMLANLSLHVKDLGFDGQQTALLYSTVAAFSFGGKIFAGWVIDQWGSKFAAGMTIALMAIVMLILMSGTSRTTLLLGSAVLGLGTGGVMPMWTSLIASVFGARSFGRAIGVQNPMHIPITAPSAPLAGYISDTTGSYQLMFMVYLGLCVVAACALVFVRPLTRHADSGPAAA